MENRFKPGVDDLQNNEKYKLVKTLKHEEIVHFVLRQLGILRWPMVSFYTLTFLLFATILMFSVYNFIHAVFTWGAFFLYLFYGLGAGMILIIPFHEALHGLAYKIAGAKKVKYGMDPGQMLFYASAPGFVAGKNSFMMVAFFPFVFISLLFLTGFFFGQPLIRWASLVALFIHCTLCIGDFAMINFLTGFPGRRVYTYDDQSDKTSYFYVTKI